MSKRKATGMGGRASVGAAAVFCALLGATLEAPGVGSLGVGLVGCAVGERDIQRWETTERGPEKLVAVITHDKYSWELRTAAALSLVRMKPRGGRKVGLDLTVSALQQLPEQTRLRITSGMMPELLKQIQAPPPKRQGDVLPPDPSIPYKDAAFGFLQEKPPLVADDKQQAVRAALAQWIAADFDARADNGAQQYGVEQMLRFLGPSAVEALPALIVPESFKIDRLIGLTNELGSDGAKIKASEALVKVASYIESSDWVAKSSAIVEESNKKNDVKVKPDQFKAQVTAFQDQELEKIFSAMKKIGHRPAIEFCLAYAKDKNKSKERRAKVLAALAHHIDKTKPADIETVFVVASDDTTPDEVRDVAFQRLGELPKDVIVPKLYTLFEGRKWKVRWVAASLVLKTITPADIPEFMRKLPPKPTEKMGLNEPVSYGPAMARMDTAGGTKAREAITPYLNAKETGARLTALAFFYGGKKADTAIVEAHQNDTAPVPKCDDADECNWTCNAPKAAGSQETEAKKVATVGDFVKFCVVPSME